MISIGVIVFSGWIHLMHGLFLILWFLHGGSHRCPRCLATLRVITHLARVITRLTRLTTRAGGHLSCRQLIALASHVTALRLLQSEALFRSVLVSDEAALLTLTSLGGHFLLPQLNVVAEVLVAGGLRSSTGDARRASLLVRISGDLGGLSRFFLVDRSRFFLLLGGLLSRFFLACWSGFFLLVGIHGFSTLLSVRLR